MPARNFSLKGWGSALVVLALLAVGIPTAARLIGAQPASPGADGQNSPGGQAGGPAVLVWSESDAEMDRSVIYAAAPDRLEAPQVVAEFDHLAGYPPIGKVSPDGQKIAVLIAPLEASERTVRLTVNQIWVMAADGSDLRLATDQAGYLNAWSPDSSQISFSSLLADEQSSPDAAPRAHLFVVDSQGSEPPQLIAAEEGSTALWPLGWGSDPDHLVFGQVETRNGQWTVVEWDIQTGQAVRSLDLPGQPNVQAWQTDPASGQALLSVIEGDLASILQVDLAAGDVITLASVPLNGQQASPLTALWTGTEQRLLLHERRPDGKAVQVVAPAAVLNSEASLANPAFRPASPYRPLAVSPDGSWLALRDYADPDLPIYLQQTGSAELVSLPRSSPGSFIDVLGWRSQ